MQLDFIQGTDGGRVCVAHAGVGPTVVLAHGYLLDHTSYAHVSSLLLAKGFRVVAFDQRGHGQSQPGSAGLSPAAMAGDYLSVLEHFQVREGRLVGHSMGGFLSVVANVLHPVRMRKHLRGMVLLGATAGNVAEGSLANRLQIPLLKSGLLERLWRRPRIGRAIVSQLFGPGAKPEWLESTLEILLRNEMRPTLPIAQALIDEDWYPRLSEVGVSTQVLCGTHDRTCPRSHSERLARYIPEARLRMLPDVGHMVPLEAPEAVVAALTS